MIKQNEIINLKRVKAVWSGFEYDVNGFIYDRRRQIIGFKIITKYGEVKILENQFKLFIKWN